MVDVSDYTALITSQHSDKPKFLATISALVQPMVDIQNAMRTMSQAYDLDTAVGVQLDVDGLWLGRSRYVAIPVSDVYFSFDTPGLGFDEAIWYTTGAPVSGIIALPDEIYRTLLKAVAAANVWDGTIPGAYRIWAVAFAGLGFTLGIQDNQDMTMTIILYGATPDVVTKALLTSGYLDLRPAGVLIDGYEFPTSTPLFAWGPLSPGLGGWGDGFWTP